MYSRVNARRSKQSFREHRAYLSADSSEVSRSAWCLLSVGDTCRTGAPLLDSRPRRVLGRWRMPQLSESVSAPCAVGRVLIGLRRAACTVEHQPRATAGSS